MIVAYGGSFSADNVTSLKSLGWLPCDGTSYRKLDYPDLALAIGNNYGGTGGFHGNFNVPDLRGRFLRGTSLASGNDPDAASRVAANPGGNSGNAVGSLQLGATGQPNVPFATSSGGLHSHGVPHAPVNNNAYAIIGSHYGLWNNGSVTTDMAGAHSHSVVNFDAETRPLNTYVNFIINYQQPESV